jgi:hypothetical protein
MKAISILQPWAHLIIHGGKDIENREWWTGFRGRVAIHASKRSDRSESEAATQMMYRLGMNKPCIAPHAIAFGAIIGTVEIVDCVKDSMSPWFFGTYGFVLRNPVSLTTPVPCRGALGFWDIPADVLSQMREVTRT